MGKIKKFFNVFWHVAIALIIAFSAVLVDSKPAAALNAHDYFTFSYGITLSKTEVEEGEIFQVSATIEVVCTKDLPLTFSEATISGRIVARSLEDGTTIVLNPQYVTNVNPFPSKQGNIVTDSQSLDLQFPGGTKPGTYSIIGEVISARAKFLVIWVDITNYLPAEERSKLVGSVTLKSAESTSTDNSTSDSEPDTPDISQSVGTNGIFLDTIVVESTDGKCQLTVEEGTRGLNRENGPVTEITMVKMETPPAPPANSSIIGSTYDLKPDGATFSPPVNLTIEYTDSQIPAGFDEEDLVISTWNNVYSMWTQLPSSVNPTLNTVTATVSHFSAFAIIAYSKMTNFKFSGLSISPAEAAVGEEVTITALVANTGDLNGSYEVVLKIDNKLEDTRQINLKAGEETLITFKTSRNTAGTYSIDINGLSGTFLVYSPAKFAVSRLSISPARAAAGEEVTISVLAANTGELAGSFEVVLKIDNNVEDTKQINIKAGEKIEVPFRVSRNTPGEYSIDINGLSGAFVIKSPSSFTFSGLSIVPAKAAAGEEVTISALAANTGDLAGSYKVVLKVDNKVEDTSMITLEAGSEKQVTFKVSRKSAGTYSINVNGLSGAFVVNSPVSLTPINGQPDKVRSISWWLIGGIVIGAAVIGLFLYFLIRKRG